MSAALLQPLPLSSSHQVEVLRLDRFHALAPGNKWFKLAPNVAAARSSGARTLVSFGGVWSNHIHALAAMSRDSDFACTAFVRGDPRQPLTAMLADARQWGVQLRFLSRSDYRRRFDRDFVAGLLASVAAPYLIPEGGANPLGAGGCGAILDLLPQRGRHYDVIMLACGTGSTLAGMVAAYHGRGRFVGVPVLPAEKFMAEDIRALLLALGSRADNWRLDHRFHGGAYAALPMELRQFMAAMETQFGLCLDPVYTVKLFHGAARMMAAGEIASGSRVLLIHSGGLQGRRGFVL